MYELPVLDGPNKGAAHDGYSRKGGRGAMRRNRGLTSSCQTAVVVLGILGWNDD